METLKQGWAMPPKPVEKCDECGGDFVPIVLLDMGWAMFWECDRCGDTPDVPAEQVNIEWPFEDLRDSEGNVIEELNYEQAMQSQRQLEALGFTIV